jgi:hypothetical protein
MRDELTLQLFAFRNVEIYSLTWPLFPIFNVKINEELPGALTNPMIAIYHVKTSGLPPGFAQGSVVHS